MWRAVCAFVQPLPLTLPIIKINALQGLRYIKGNTPTQQQYDCLHLKPSIHPPKVKTHVQRSDQSNLV